MQHREGISRLALLAFGGMILLGASTPLSAQQDLRERSIFSYQLFGSDTLDSSGFLQIHDLRWERDLGAPFRLRLSFHGEGNDGQSEIADSKTTNRYWLLQPGAQLDYLLETLRVRGNYDLYETTSKRDDIEGRQRLQRIFASMIWSPEAYPSVTLQGEDRQHRDDFAAIHQNDRLLFESVSWTRRGLTLSQTASWGDTDLEETRFSRRQTTLQGQAAYQGSLFDGRLTGTATATAGISRLDETAPGEASSVPTQAPIANALVSRDETPADSRDTTPVSTFQLIDSIFNQSAGVSVGPDGSSFQVLTLDMNRVIALDDFRVFIRDGSGNGVRFGGLVAWDVWTSGNGQDWTLVTSGAPAAFIPSLSAYEIRFRRTSSRWFKLVNFGTNSLPSFVTEVQAFFHTEFAAGETRRTDLRTLSANAQVAGRITDRITLGYYGLFNDFTTSPGGKADYASYDQDQLVSAQISAAKGLDVTLRYEDRRAHSEGFATSMQGYWGIVQYAFNARSLTSVEASRTRETTTREITSDTIRLHQYAQLLRSVNVDLEGGVASDEDTETGLHAKRTFANATGWIQLTRALRVNLAANFTRVRYPGSQPENFENLPTRDERYYVEAWFRPSATLALSGRYGIVRGSQVSATTKTWRVEWYPLAGGTIGIGTIYDEDVEVNGFERRFRRIQVLPHWAINKHAQLDVNYNYLTLYSSGVAGAPSTTAPVRQFYATLTLNL